MDQFKLYENLPDLMKLIFTILFFGIATCVYAQDSVNDTIVEVNESLYIDDHKTQFNVKFDVSNDITTFKLPKEKIQLNIKPNLNIKYALVLSYKFASITLGIRPRLSDEDKENKGDSNTFSIRFKLLFDNWSHNFEYDHNRGYYIENSDDFALGLLNSDFHIQFPNLTTDIFFGSSSYKFNTNYSVRAIESQTEIQIKSAGTFMPSIRYTFYGIKGTDKIKISEDETITRENYMDTQGFNMGLFAGYYYTFVFQKHWYVNAYLSPGIAIDFYKTKNYMTNETFNRSFNEVFYSLQSGIGLGYNGKKMFFGAEYTNMTSSQKFSENNVQIQLTKNSLHVFVGYRFKAPKPVKKSIDLIEDKVPILNENYNK